MGRLSPQQILDSAFSFNLDDPEFLRLYPKFHAAQALLLSHEETAQLRCALYYWPDETRMLIGYPRDEVGPLEHDIVTGYHLAQLGKPIFFGQALAWKSSPTENNSGTI